MISPIRQEILVWFKCRESATTREFIKAWEGRISAKDGRNALRWLTDHGHLHREVDWSKLIQVNHGVRPTVTYRVPR